MLYAYRLQRYKKSAYLQNNFNFCVKMRHAIAPSGYVL